jgi:hypothetical protein
MSLFPDEYPDEGTTPPQRRSCCEHLEAPDGIGDLTWRLAHSFAHTRSPVGPNSLAGLAGCRPKEALSALVHAEGAGWMRAVLPEPYQKNPPPLWLGRLSQRS